MDEHQAHRAQAAGSIGSDSDGIRSGVATIAEAAPDLAPLIDTAVSEAVGAPSARAEAAASSLTTGHPDAIVVQQRDAMALAVDFRDDPRRPPQERAVWAHVVENLAVARRQAKETLGRKRRRDPGRSVVDDAVEAKERAVSERGYDERSAGEIPGDVTVGGSDIRTPGSSTPDVAELPPHG
jgi:hypothetical protein